MKRIVRASVVLLMFVLCTISCNKKVVQEKNQEVENSDLLLKLSNFHNKPHIEGFWSDVGAAIGNACIVVGADIAGAATGVKSVAVVAAELNVVTTGTAGTALVVSAGVISGAGASYGAVKVIDKEVKPKTGRLNIKLPNKYDYLKDLGIIHNKVIYQYYYLNEPLHNYYTQLSNEDYQFFNTLQYEVVRNDVENYGKQYAINNFDFPAYSQQLFDAGYISLNVKSVLNLFMSEYIKCSQYSDIEDVVNFYIDAVSNSDLDESDKIALLSSFMVASESPFYLLAD